MKKNNADSEWSTLCKELEQAKAAYEAAETHIACKTDAKEAENKDALKDSLQAAKRMIDVLEKMRKFHTRQD